MTSSTTETAGHPDVAEISDLAEGILPPSRTTDVRRHLETCESCADVYASLEEIQGLLGTLSGPQRMPDDVAARIDAALAAEALLSPAAPATSTAAEGESPVPDRAQVSRETSAANRPSGRARTATTGPGRKDRRRYGRRRIAVLGAVAAAAALGIGSVIVSSVTGGSPSEDTAQGQQTAPVDTFAEAKLQKQVAGLIADGQSPRSGSRTPRSFGTESETENHVFTQPTVVVPECVQRAIGRDEAALATEEGVYKGKEALLVVLPDALNDSRVTAYIVDSACVAQPAVGKATVLLQHSYARP
ncbi:anti-sigma factor family protein [Streptomyces sp. NPDC127100]|uniref:anti-sigma factor family protein n=1 Tax=Streptomyces sp. NPDC127100 TaxID=3347138 RepID=UPI00366100EF